jgi:hypothetical protein
MNAYEQRVVATIKELLEVQRQLEELKGRETDLKEKVSSLLAKEGKKTKNKDAEKVLRIASNGKGQKTPAQKAHRSKREREADLLFAVCEAKEEGCTHADLLRAYGYRFREDGTKYIKKMVREGRIEVKEVETAGKDGRLLTRQRYYASWEGDVIPEEESASA